MVYPIELRKVDNCGIPEGFTSALSGWPGYQLEGPSSESPQAIAPRSVVVEAERGSKEGE
jgi:hypothetical protein